MPSSHKFAFFWCCTYSYICTLLLFVCYTSLFLIYCWRVRDAIASMKFIERISLNLYLQGLRKFAKYVLLLNCVCLVNTYFVVLLFKWNIWHLRNYNLRAFTNQGQSFYWGVGTYTHERYVYTYATNTNTSFIGDGDLSANTSSIGIRFVICN